MQPRTLALLSLAGAACTSAPDDETGPPPICEHAPRPARALRIFAVGHQLEVAEGATYATYASAFRATVDREVIPHLATDRQNVLVFPESVAFTAAFVGARGDDARTKDTAFLAYSTLEAQLQDAFVHYRGLAPFGQIGTWILLAATDPTWRAFDQTFSAIARDTQAYVVASIDVGDVSTTDDPTLAAQLGDPERPAGSPVYEVPDGKLYNQAVVYGPDGTLLGKMRKVYLTDPEENQLGVTGHLPEHVTLDVDGLASIAAAISRDAWMPDLQDRIAAAGTELMLQPEAFDTWTAPDPGGPWPADNLKRSSWGAVQKHPELRVAAAPMLVGNFFDVKFDGQTFIAEPGVPSMARQALLGQPADTGWAAIAPWVASQLEGVAWADLDLAADDAYPAIADAHPASEPLALGPSSAVAPSGTGRQRGAAPIVLADGSVVVAWEDTRYCTGQIVVARSGDGGATFGDPVRVSPWNRAQHDPSLVALPDGRLVVAWQEVLGDGRAEVRVATSRDGGATWSHRVRVDPTHSVDAWQPSLAADASDGTLYLAFVDSRGDDPNRRVYLTRSHDAGASWSAPARVDSRDRPDGPDPTLSNEWSPRIVASTRHLVVAYTHRERPDPNEQPSWDATITESDDGGTTFGQPQRLDPGGFPERIAADTALALAPGGDWRAAFSTYRGTQADSDLILAAPGAPFRLAAQPSYQWWPSLVALADGTFALAWQDFRHGGNDLYVARVTAAGVGQVLRPDDAGDSDAQAWRPRLAAAPDGTLYAFWEDSRSGHAELRVAHGALP